MKNKKLNKKYDEKAPIWFGSEIIIQNINNIKKLLFSEGIFDNILKIKTYGENNPYYISKSVFKILPYSKNLLFKIQEDIKRLYTKEKNNSIKKDFDELAKIKNKFWVEINGLIKFNNKNENSFISYEKSNFMLFHKFSLKFLTLNDDNNDNIHYTLEDFPNENSSFIFTKCYNIEKDLNTLIHDCDLIYIRNKVEKNSKFIYIFNNDFEKNQFANIKKSEINASIGEPYKWKILLYKSQEIVKENNFIKTGEILNINLSEIPRELDFSEKNLNFFENNKNISSNLFYIDNIDHYNYTSEKIYFNKKYILKDFKTNKNILKNFNKKYIIIEPINKYKIKESNFVNKNNFIKLKIDNEEYLNYNDEDTKYNTLKLNIINFKEIWKNNFLLEIYPELEKNLNTFIEILEKENDKYFNEFYDYMKNIINYWKKFLFNKLSQCVDLNKNIDEISLEKQNNLINLNIHQLIIIYIKKLWDSLQNVINIDFINNINYIFKNYKLKEQNNNFYIFKSKFKKEDFKILMNYFLKMKLIRKFYLILKYLINNNKNNQIIISKYIDIYNKNIFYFPNLLKIIIPIFKNNYEVLNNFSKFNSNNFKVYSNDDFIDYNDDFDIFDISINSLKYNIKQYNYNILIFLKNLIGSQKNLVYLNQNLILNKLIKYKIFNWYFFKILTSNDKLIVNYELNKFIELEIFNIYNNNFINKNKNKYKFLLHQLNLYCSLSYNCNISAFNYLKEKFNKFILFEYLFNENLNFDLKAKLIKLFRILFIDMKNFKFIKKPNKVLIIKDYEEENITEFKNKKIIIKNIQNENLKKKNIFNKKTIKKLINLLINIYKNNKNNNNLYNELLLEIIKIIEILFKIGYITKQKKIKKIVKILCKILEFKKEYKNNLKKIKILNEKKTIFKNWKNSFKTKSSNIIISEKIKDFDNNNKFNEIIKEIEFNSIFNNYLILIKILEKFTNKISNFSSNKNLSKINLINKIKIKICDILIYYNQMRQELLIKNTKNIFKNLKDNNFKILDYKKIFGNKKLNINKIDNKIKDDFKIKDFDNHLNKSFLKIIFISYYFTNNYNLKIKLIKLLEHYTYDKKYLLKNLNNSTILKNIDDLKIYIEILNLYKELYVFEYDIQFWILNIKKVNFNRIYFESLIVALKAFKDLIYLFQNNKKNHSNIFIQKLIIEVKFDKFFFKIIKSLENSNSIYEKIIFEEIESFEFKLEILENNIELFKSIFKNIFYLIKNNSNLQIKILKYYKFFIKYEHLNLGQIDILIHLFKNNIKNLKEIPTEINLYIINLLKNYPHNFHILKYFVKITQNNSKELFNIKKYILSLIFDNNDFINPFIKNNNLKKKSENKYTFGFNYHYCYNKEDQNYLKESEEIKLKIKNNKKEYLKNYFLLINNCLYKDIGIGIISRLFKVIHIKQIFQLYLYLCENLIKSENDLKLDKKKISIKIMVFNIINCYGFYYDNNFEIFLYNPKNILFLNKFFEEEYDKFSKLIINSNTNYYFKFLIKYLLKFIYICQINFNKQKIKEVKFADKFYIKLKDFIIWIYKKFEVINKNYKFNQKKLEFMHKISSLSNISFNISQLYKNWNLDKKGEEYYIKDNYYKIDKINLKDIIFKRFSKKRNIINEWRIFLFNLNKQKKFIRKDEKIICENIYNFENIYNNEKYDIINNEKIIIKRNDIISKLIGFIKYSNDDNQNEVNFIIKLFKSIIKFQNNKNKIFNLQLEFNNFNFIEILFNIICKKNEFDYLTLKNLFEFKIFLLSNENKIIQNSFYYLFFNSLDTDKYFKNLFNYLIIISEKLNLKNIIIDKYNYKIINLLITILKFIRLLVEGHFKELQIYIRKQKNSKISYDILENILNIFEKITINNQNYNLVENLFETITELIQGPCKENQLVVINHNFLENLINLLEENNEEVELNYSTINETKKSLIQTKKNSRTTLIKSSMFGDEIIKKKIRLENHINERIKIKFIKLIFAILEDNINNELIINKLIRVIPFSLLKNNLIKNYAALKVLYNNNYTRDQFFIYNKELNENIPKLYNECYIEIGIYIFILMTIFNENKKLNLSDKIFRKEIKKNDTSNIKKKRYFIINFILFFYKLFYILFYYISKIFRLKKKKDIKLKNNTWKEKIKKLRNQENSYKNAINYFKYKCSNIEIIRNNKLEKIYFPVIPNCFFLEKNIKKNFHEKVNRNNITSKLIFFLISFDNIIFKIDYEFYINNLFKNSIFTNFLIEFYEFFYDLSLLISIVINLIMLIYYGKYLNIKDYGNDNAYIISILGLILLVISLIKGIIYFFKNVPILIKNQKIKYKSKFNRKLDWNSTFKLTLKYYFKIFITLSKSFEFMYNIFSIIFIILALLGYFINHFTLFFIISLLDIIRIDILRNIILAIIRRTKPFIYTILMISIIAMYFSLVGFYFFYIDYPNERCNSLWKCFFVTYDLSFKNFGGISYTLESQEKYEGSMKFLRYIFDEANRILLYQIMLNIVAAIIIDEFGSIKEKNAEILEDKENICFICGLDRNTLEKTKSGFEKHIKETHYMWNYLYYAEYWKFLPILDYDGNDTFIFQKLKSNNLDWFPVGKTKDLEDKNENLNNENKNFIYLFNNLEKINNEINDNLIKNKK